MHFRCKHRTQVGIENRTPVHSFRDQPVRSMVRITLSLLRGGKANSRRCLCFRAPLSLSAVLVDGALRKRHDKRSRTVRESRHTSRKHVDGSLLLTPAVHQRLAILAYDCFLHASALPTPFYANGICHRVKP